MSAIGLSYRDLIETNRRRGRHDPEYELIDTGVLDDDRYFDVFVEYAKAAPQDILIRVAVVKISCATRAAVGRSLAGPKSFSAVPIGATICCSTNIFTATTAPASAPAIRRAGQVWSPS